MMSLLALAGFGIFQTGGLTAMMRLSGLMNITTMKTSSGKARALTMRAGICLPQWINLPPWKPSIFPAVT